jgi:hypothetical protein
MLLFMTTKYAENNIASAMKSALSANTRRPLREYLDIEPHNNAVLALNILRGWRTGATVSALNLF